MGGNAMARPCIDATTRDESASGVGRRRFLVASAATGLAAALGAADSKAETPATAAAPRGDKLPGSIADAGRRFREGSLGSEQLTQAYLGCIERFEPKLNAFITLMRDQALETARKRDQELSAGRDRGPLHGIPIVVKDIYEMAGTVTTVGSKAFRDRKTDQDATTIRQLKDAGVVILGKTNMNEFAAGVSGTNAEFGDTHNPWELEHSPGGSSSGTGAALAAGVCLGGTGTDTGGSIRIPASWSGITGIRPTFGLVSLSGVFPRSYSLDSAGPLARNVADLAYLLDAMAGFDPSDPHSSLAQSRQSYTSELDHGVAGLTFGVVANYTFRDVDPAVAEAVHHAVETFGRLGAHVIEIEVPPLAGQLDYGTLFNNMLLYEFNQILGDRYRSTPNAKELYGPIVQNNIDVGSRVPRDAYERLVQERPGVIAQVKAAFKRVDAMLTPALPTVAPLLKASAQDYGRGRQFTIPFSYTALPCLVVPCGFSPDGLPIGLQIVGDHFQERQLLRIGAAFEAATSFHERHPPIFCS
jgi:aspartyl-tRNA(Asn)/glutamyl-tRNA(Gln) amidotransferase subunit A